MDRPRQRLLLTCTALAKLRQELYGWSVLRSSPEWYGRVRDLERTSAWLDGVLDNFALSGVFNHVMRVQSHLLAMIAREGEIDCLRACVVLQHIANDRQSSGWPKPVLRLATQLGVTFSPGPGEVTFQSTLRDLPAGAFPARLNRALLDELNKPTNLQRSGAMLRTVHCTHPTTNKKRRRKASDFPARTPPSSRANLRHKVGRSNRPGSVPPAGVGRPRCHRH